MWDKLEQAISSDAGQGLDVLITELEQGDDPHLLFDAICLKGKSEHDLPLLQPTSVAEVPRDLKTEFEQVYIDAARRTGQALLDRKRLADAWMYFRAINEPEPVTAAIEECPVPDELDDSFEELIQLALYQRVNPPKGVELMLATHGMCNTVTALDQLYLDITPADRTRCARLMVNQLYDDLLHNVRNEVSQRTPMLPPDQSLRELIAGRIWLFENDNYHTDVSHLNAVVRFARALEGSDTAELEKAIQLAEYGDGLSPHLQYPSEPPFDTYYLSHQHYFKIVKGEEAEESLQFFKDRLAQATEPQDRELIAYVLVDLLMRTDDFANAIAVAEEHLNNVHEQSGFSFVSLCQDTNDMEALRRHARKVENPVLFAAAHLQRQQIENA